MKTRTLRLLTTAWWRSIVRDRATLFWFFAFPILFIVIFGLAFGSDTVGPFKVGLAADTGTPAGAALSQAFGSVKAFKMSTGTRDALVQKLKDGARQ